MPEDCEIVAFVRSERVVVEARVSRVLVPQVATLAGPSYSTVRTAAVRYGWRLAKGHGEALTEARRLAAETDQPLRIVDLGRCNPIARALRLRLLGGPALPAVVMKGSCRWDRLAPGREGLRSQEARA